MLTAGSLVLVLASAACAQIFPTPNDFPAPPATIIVEFPTPTVEPTFAPKPRSVPILSGEMDNARAFFLVTRAAALAGDDHLIADRILYPIPVRINGQASLIRSPDEFSKHYTEIFDDALIKAISAANEQDLVALPEGIRVGEGVFWYNLFCMNAACTQTDFLITQINI